MEPFSFPHDWGKPHRHGAAAMGDPQLPTTLGMELLTEAGGDLMMKLRNIPAMWVPQLSAHPSHRAVAPFQHVLATRTTEIGKDH